MELHHGINTTSVARYGLGGLPGLMMAIAFVLLFAGIFVPRAYGNWYLAVFLTVEAVACGLYILSDRRSREETECLLRQIHRINEEPHRIYSRPAAVHAATEMPVAEDQAAASAEEFRRLQDENEMLKALVAQLKLENHQLHERLGI